VRAEIIRREEAGAAGVRKIQEEVAPFRNLSENLHELYEEARQFGMSPQDLNAHIGRTMMAERALRNPDPMVRLEAIFRVADTYGIPLRQLTGAPAAQQPQQPAQQPQLLDPRIEQELAEARRWREEQMSTSADRQVADWSKGKEFFDDVRQVMGDLIEKGFAKGLDDAYDQACWSNPEIRGVLTKRQIESTNLKQKQEAAERVNLKSNGGVEVDNTDDDDDIASLVRKQFLNGGRT
jgi:hypothetical protein